MASSNPVQKPIDIFIAYAKADEQLKNDLALHLKNLERQRKIRVWHDEKIQAGDNWEQEIHQNLAAAHIVLLLISHNFLASDFYDSHEMKLILERQEEGSVHVIPIVLSPVDWDGSYFKNLKALPKGATPISEWKNKNQAFLTVVKSIREVVDSLS